MYKVRLAQQLSLSDWLILIRAWWMLLFFHLALRWVSYDRLQYSPHLMSSENNDTTVVVLLAQRYQRMIAWASRLHLMPMTCLVKSLTLHWMLVRRGIPVQVRIGVMKSLDGIQAHAWAEVMGETLGEWVDVSTRFTMLKSLTTH